MKRNLNQKLNNIVRQILLLWRGHYAIKLTIFILLLGAFVYSTIYTIPVFADTIDYNVNVKPTLSLSLSSSSISLNLNPANNVFGTGNLDVAVATNNLNGYRLYISSNPVSISSAGSDITNDATSLINTTSSINKIETLDSTIENATPSNFPANKWGYRITNGANTNPAITSATNYYPFALNTWINYSVEPINNSMATLSFASKIDYDKPAGIYERTFDFKALPIVTQTYMQNINPSVCTTDPTIVIDSRDEHPYIIQRLADNKCWMLDNLDLDLTDRDVVDNLTTTNTNINTLVDPNALNYLKNGGGTASDKYAIKGLSNSMHAYSNWTNGYSYSEPLLNRNGKCNNTCVGVWQDADYTHSTVLDKADADNVVIKDNANNIGGPGSYQVGTYYNYCAASAGTYCYGDGTTIGSSSGNATSDICPAGWHMPSIGADNGDYNILCSAIKGSACVGDWNAMAITDATSIQYQLSLPLSGRYYGSIGGAATRYADYLGRYGLFWTSTRPNGGDNSDGMYNLLVRFSGVHLSDATKDNRIYGYSIRCLLQES